MLRFTLARGAFAAFAALASTAAAAQTAPPRPDPLDARAAVPRVEHRSALAGYRAHVPAEPADWRAANERVNRIGGWRSYAREATSPESPAPAASAPAHRH